MLNLFRKKYPQGSLIGKLVKIDCGKYIVKASVIVDGITLASGLAAEYDIELAEDKARARAIDLLQLDLNSSETNIQYSSNNLKQEKGSVEPQTTKTSSRTKKKDTLATKKITERDRKKLDSPPSINSVKKIYCSPINPLLDLPKIPKTENQLNNSNSETRSTENRSNGQEPPDLPSISQNEVDIKTNIDLLRFHADPAESKNQEQQPQHALESTSATTQDIDSSNLSERASETIDSTPSSEPLREIVSEETKTNNSSEITSPDKSDLFTQGSLFEIQPENTPFGSSEQITPIELPPEAIEQEDPIEENYEDRYEDRSDLVEKSQTEADLKPIQITIDEIITQTNFEMKRLGWTKEKGREHLLSVYGKPSRYKLNDRELLEFLEFLKNQEK